MIGINLETIENGASLEIIKEKYSLDKTGISTWLRDKNIITKYEKLLSFKDLIPWSRKGGETYGTMFEFSTNKQKKQLFIKAIVTINSEKSLDDWAKRRKILCDNAISVSNWYFHGNGIIIEDYYPKTVKKKNFLKILNIGYRLDKLGFSSLKFIDDIRGDNNGNLYYIDFGFDLGEPSLTMKTNAKECLIKAFPDRQNEINNYYI